MRSFLVLLCALSSVTAAAAQTPQTPSRWTLSAGRDQWYYPNVWGMRLRADYDLLGGRGPFRLGLLMGGSWGPSQLFSNHVGGNTYYSGEVQRGDVIFGLTSALTPLPKARFSPYLTFGVVARQVWMNGTTYMWDPTNPQATLIERSRTYGHITSTFGWGLRMRIHGRMFQLEHRVLYDLHSVTFGTSLPFE